MEDFVNTVFVACPSKTGLPVFLEVNSILPAAHATALYEFGDLTHGLPRRGIVCQHASMINRWNLQAVQAPLRKRFG
jgi:hypothetical protein